MTNERWQHKVVEIKSKWHGGMDLDEVQTQLDRLGLQGWQLVSVVQRWGENMQLYLKRLA